MIDNNTVVKEKGKFQDEKLGVWVDIFPLDGVGNDLEKAKREVENNKRYVKQILLLEEGKKINNKGRLLYFVGRKRLHHILKHNLKRPSFYESTYVADIATLYDDIVIYNSDSFKGKRACNFENMEFNIPSNSEYILGTIYGDYMKLPPEEERIPTHDCKVWIKE